jgi:hypothetical protein
MKITLTPQRSDATLAISVSGETVTINGIAYDLSPLDEGQSVSFGGGSAKRDNGITVSLPLPYPQNPSIDQMQVYEVEAVDGPVPVPGHDAKQPTAIVAGVIGWPAPEIPPTQFELDQRRYQKRAAVQSELLSWMAADNMSRVRSGVWTVADLTSLMSDPAVTAAQAYMSTLSYELAAQAIQAATTPLLTPEIKSTWISKLTEHFYLVP